MTEKAERNFLKREQALAAAWPGAELKAYFEQREQALKELIEQAPSRSTGRKFVTLLGNLRQQLIGSGLSLLFRGSPLG